MLGHRSGSDALKILISLLLAACGSPEPESTPKKETNGVVAKLTWADAVQQAEPVAERLFVDHTGTVTKGHYVVLLQNGAVGAGEFTGESSADYRGALHLVGFLSKEDGVQALRLHKQFLLEGSDPEHQSQIGRTDRNCDGAAGKTLQYQMKFPPSASAQSSGLRKRMAGPSGCLAYDVSFGTDTANRMIALLDRAVGSATASSPQVPIPIYR